MERYISMFFAPYPPGQRAQQIEIRGRGSIGVERRTEKRLKCFNEARPIHR
jgi:hypothetical protein